MHSFAFEALSALFALINHQQGKLQDVFAGRNSGEKQIVLLIESASNICCDVKRATINIWDECKFDVTTKLHQQLAFQLDKWSKFLQRTELRLEKQKKKKETFKREQLFMKAHFQ
ncbi:CLUMA_CG003794, isoform A [Clunio marinus]|uniref:CLUMA_CG003794, isoform A n=1 Tax=Clunio marinus TaxID=568069 RepID=A0A1J1HQ22_9DIPT|nr:CLUMA_CG003794, isoform A [Clunio marinus]